MFISSRRQKKIVTKPRRSSKKLFFLRLILMAIPLWFGYKILQSYLVEPEAIFVLGGAEEREKFAADLAKKHPKLQIWVSSGSPKGYVKKIFARRGIEGDRLHLDYQASDTVTNFTTLVNELEASSIDSVYLVTSENHMLRALVVGEIIFGSRGIVIKPASVPAKDPPEPMQKCWRDGARAVLWLATGYAGPSKPQ